MVIILLCMMTGFRQKQTLIELLSRVSFAAKAEVTIDAQRLVKHLKADIQRFTQRKSPVESTGGIGEFPMKWLVILLKQFIVVINIIHDAICLHIFE